jgi:hypothetical protein
VLDAAKGAALTALPLSLAPGTEFREPQLVALVRPGEHVAQQNYSRVFVHGKLAGRAAPTLGDNALAAHEPVENAEQGALAGLLCERLIEGLGGDAFGGWRISASIRSARLAASFIGTSIALFVGSICKLLIIMNILLSLKSNSRQ